MLIDIKLKFQIVYFLTYLLCRVHCSMYNQNQASFKGEQNCLSLIFVFLFVCVFLANGKNIWENYERFLLYILTNHFDNILIFFTPPTTLVFCGFMQTSDSFGRANPTSQDGWF